MTISHYPAGCFSSHTDMVKAILLSVILPSVIVPYVVAPGVACFETQYIIFYYLQISNKTKQLINKKILLP